MSLEARVTAALARVGQEIKDLREEQGVDSWVFGPLANASSAYKAKAQGTDTEVLKMVVLSDSTSDGFVGGGVTGGSATWDHVWPGQLAALLRSQLKLPIGGDGWIPPSTPTWPGGYNYRPALLRPESYTELDELNFQIGVPGSLWLQQGHASKVYDVQYTLSPNTTSIDIVTTRYGGNVNVICGNSASTRVLTGTATREFTRVNNPGGSVRLYGDSGVGFAMLGIIEHVGDESTGVQMMNLAQASIQAAEVLSWLQNTDYSLEPLIAAYAPDVALVVLGSNDLSNGGKTPTQTSELLGAIAMRLQAAVPGIEVVFVMRPNPSVEFGQLVDLVNAGAPSLGVRSLDVRNDPRIAMPNPSIYVSDNVHFNAAGDTAMASVIADYLRVERVPAGSGGGGGGLSEEEVQTLIDNTLSTKPRRWQSEVIINSSALADGWNDNVGGVLIDSDIILYQAAFRIADPTMLIGGTGNLQIQWYAGSVTALETELITTTQIAAGQHDVIVTLATPMPYTINTVLRAKITRGTTTVAGPCHIQWRGRYQ